MSLLKALYSSNSRSALDLKTYTSNYKRLPEEARDKASLVNVENKSYFIYAEPNSCNELGTRRTHGSETAEILILYK